MSSIVGFLMNACDIVNGTSQSQTISMNMSLKAAVGFDL